MCDKYRIQTCIVNTYMWKVKYIDYIKDNCYITGIQNSAQEHDHRIIEESFVDFETDCTIPEEEMKQ